MAQTFFNYEIRQIFPLQCMIQKPRPDLLTLSTTFYDLSVSCNLFSKAEMRQFGALGTQGLTYTHRVKGSSFRVTNWRLESVTI